MIASNDSPLARVGDRATPPAEAVWFDGDGVDGLFGWFHPPSEPRRDCVVVLCNPFGYDAMITHFAYRHLAERLAAAGIAALRFDYYGTGDSAGDDAAPDRIDAWLRSIDAACTEAKRRSGAGATALFGVRVGSLLAVAAAQRSSVDDLIVLGPSTSGRAAVRELRALRKLQPPIVGAKDPVAPDDDNFGFVLTEPMRAALGALEPTKVAVAPARRALVILRDDVVAEETAFVAHLRTTGVDVTVSKTPGYSLVLRGDPYTCDLPEAAWSEIIRWLSDAHATVPAGVSPPPPRRPARRSPRSPSARRARRRFASTAYSAS